MTEGRRRLLLMLGHMRSDEFASLIGVCPRYVRHWSSGEREPNRRLRWALWVRAGIPIWAWTIPARFGGSG